MNYQWEMLENKGCRGYNKLICEMLTEASHRAVRPNNERTILIMGFVEVLKKEQKGNIKTIVLPETEDMRTLGGN